MSVNRQWLLARRPQGAARREDFRLVEQPLPTQPLAAGEIEVHATLFQCAPTMRNWMDSPDPANLYPSVPLDAPMPKHQLDEIEDDAVLHVMALVLQ